MNPGETDQKLKLRLHFETGCSNRLQTFLWQVPHTVLVTSALPIARNLARVRECVFAWIVWKMNFENFPLSGRFSPKHHFLNPILIFPCPEATTQGSVFGWSNSFCPRKKIQIGGAFPGKLLSACTFSSYDPEVVQKFDIFWTVPLDISMFA